MSYKSSIFRKASLERVLSPDQLNDYIKVSHPSVWLILAALTVLLIGVLVWSIFGTLTTARDAVAVVVNGNATCYIKPEVADGITVEMPVHIADSNGIVTAISTTPIEIPSNLDAYARYLGGFQSGDFVVCATVDIDIPDGVYSAQIILESISPISFILN